MIFCYYCLSSKHRWAQCPLNSEEHLLQQESKRYLLSLISDRDPECLESIFSD